VNKNRLIRVFVLLLTTGLAFLFSFLLTQNTTLGTVAFVLGLGVTIVFVEPFIGLLNYLFFLYVRPQEFVAGFVGLPVMLMLGSATFAFTVLHMALKRNPLGLSRAPQNYLMVWFLIALPVSQLANANMHGANQAFQDFLPTFLLFLMISIMLTSVRRVRIFFYLLLILTVFLAVQGIYQYYTGIGIGGQELRAGRIAGLGIFNDPNDLALALLIVLPFCFHELTSSRNLMVRAMNLLFAAAIITTVFMSESRGGILSLGVLLLFILSRRFGWKWGLSVGSVLFLVIFVLAPRMGTISTDESSAYGRIESWTTAMDLIQWRPLFGVGARMFTDYSYLTAHNSFLLCGAELGMFGLIAWVTLIYISIKNLHFVSKHAPADRFGKLAASADAVMLGLVGFISASTFLSRTYIEMLYILLGMSAAVTTIFVRASDNNYQLMCKADLRNGILISIGGVVFFKIFLIWAW
jgi:putative inorganic carbon (HCO3(-)) transporter